MKLSYEDLLFESIFIKLSEKKDNYIKKWKDIFLIEI